MQSDAAAGPRESRVHSLGRWEISGSPWRPIGTAVALASLLAFAGLSSALSETAAPSSRAILLEQGWDEELRQLYYYTPQGSLLIPLSWFLALERTDAPGRFSDPENLQRFGWIYHDEPRADLNPANLPIGFAVDPAERAEGAWIGFTCAACHTGEVELKGTRLRVDGAPSNLDFDRFYAELAAAVRVTAVDIDPQQVRFRTFADAVLGSANTPEASKKLRGALALFEAQMSGDASIRHPSVPSGYGRVDALNQIMNAIAVRGLGVPENLRPVDAPVSYPQLWLTPKLEWVQWNPVASNPMARNVGEVLGVFGSVHFQGADAPLFQSSALIPELAELESWLNDLKSPRWPEALPLDMAKATAGKALFGRHCADCPVLERRRQTRQERLG